MFENPDDAKQRELEQKEADEKFQREQDKQWEDSQLKNKIDAKYKKMVNDLEEGRVSPDAYKQSESFLITQDQLADIPRDSKAFNSLWGWKHELRKKREDAEYRNRKIETLKEMTGKNVDMLNYEKIEREMDTPEKLREYQIRVMQGKKEPKEDSDNSDNTEYQL